MLRAVHIEDEVRNVQLLQKLVEDHCSDLVRLEGNAANMEDAIELINQTAPDLVYMDIELSSGNAFDLLDKLDGFNFAVIFITAFNQYAVKAFKYNAVDYILKPIDTDELIAATKNAKKNIEQKRGSNHILEALKMLKGTNVQKVGIPVNDGTLFVNTADIVSVEARGGVAAINLTGKKIIMASKSLKEIETLLHLDYFVRVHNSWIVNINYIKKYYKGKNGYLEMDDGSTVTISIRRKGALLDLLGREE